MRVLALFGLLIVAGCGETAGTKNEAAPKAANVEPGQWALTSEVTSFERADEGEPKINTPVGTRTTENVCVGTGDRLPVELFSGPGYDCDYANYYVRNGRVNVTLNCRREGLSGQIGITVDGRVTEEGLDFSRGVQTSLYSDGDVTIESRVTGRRTGECADPAAGAAGNKAGE